MIDALNAALAEKYAIQRELGRGGMATVYLADDLKHRRRVAIKVLHPELAAVIGAERFLREIEIAAALTHPHILPLHDSGQADGLLYYVMPYVDGESLRDRLEREKQLPIEDTVRIAREAADGLSYAHGLGVVHRDVKPENILLSGDHALVADFGIARAVSEAGGSRLTETGLSLGTPHYMSPEQASGSVEVDGRSDIYSLGCVTYEMLTGEPPHSGPNAQAIVAKVLTQPTPSVRAGRETVPTAMDAVIARALAKLPADRHATADKFSGALARSLEPGATVPRTAPGLRADRGKTERVWKTLAVAASVIAVVALGVVALWGPWRSAPAGEREVYRLSIPVEPLPLPEHPHGSAVALSEDGSMVAYVSGENDAGQLFVRSLDAIEASPVAGADNASSPFFSPDGEWLGFVADGQMFKVRLADGARVKICDAPETHGASWGADGTIVFASASDGALSRVSAEGGAPETLLVPDASTETFFVHPEFLPDGGAVLFTATSAALLPLNISVFSLRTGERTTLIEGGGTARYFEPGYLVYAQGGGLLAVPFDVSSPAIAGSPVKVVQAATGSPYHPQLAHFDVSTDGTLVYVAGASTDATEQLAWVDRDGQIEEVPLPDRRSGIGLMGIRVSPDGTRVAFWSSDPTQGGSALSGDIWLYDLARGTLTRMSSDSLEQFWVLWDPDGTRLVFTAGNATSGNLGLYSQPADATTPAERLTTVDAPRWQQPYSVTADGSVLLFQESSQGTNFDIWALPLRAGGASRPVIETPDEEYHPAISPDGRWLAYVSTESGQEEVYLTDYPERRRRWLVSAAGGTGPVWRPDGRELFYSKSVEGQTAVVAVRVEASPELVLTRPETLFEGRFAAPIRFGRTYDLSPDGRRFLMVRLPDMGAVLKRLTVVLNWGDEVKRLVEDS